MKHSIRIGSVLSLLCVAALGCSSASKKSDPSENPSIANNSDEIRVSLEFAEGAQLYERSGDATEGPQHASELVRIDQHSYLKVAKPPEHLEHGQWIVTTSKKPVTLVADKSRIEIAPNSAVLFRFAPLMQSDLRLYYGTLKLTLAAESAYSEAVLRFEQSDFILKSGVFFATAQSTRHLAYVWNLKGHAQAKQPGLPKLEPLQIPASSLIQMTPQEFSVRKPRPGERMKALGADPQARARLFSRN